MSALFNGVCYPSAEAAKQAACSAKASVWGSGGSVFTTECASLSFSGPSMEVCKRQDGGACLTIVQDYPPFPDCDFSGGVDLALEWLYLVLPVVVALWGIKRLIGLFSFNREDA